MHDPVPMKVQQPLELLKHDGFDGSGGNSMSTGLGMVMNNLKQVVFGVFKHNVDALVFQDNFVGMDDAGMGQFAAEGHLSYCRLGNTRILYLAFFVGFESARCE
jgi:hypothetical protein